MLRSICGVIVLCSVTLGAILVSISTVLSKNKAFSKKHVNFFKILLILIAIDGAIVIISFTVGLFTIHPF